MHAGLFLYAQLEHWKLGFCVWNIFSPSKSTPSWQVHVHGTMRVHCLRKWCREWEDGQWISIMMIALASPAHQGQMWVQHQWGNWFWVTEMRLHWFHIDEEVEMAVHELLLLQEPDLCRNVILKLMSWCDKCVSEKNDISLKWMSYM
jgi:hypothetical protein